jgi:hypothetical protein
MLTPAERALLFRACRDHSVARCERCGEAFRITELAADPFCGLSHLCRSCRVDLSHSVREHLISCAEAARLDAELIIAETKALLESNAAMRKEAGQLRDLAQLVRAEAEADRQKRSDDTERRDGK